MLNLLLNSIRNLENVYTQFPAVFRLHFFTDLFPFRVTIKADRLHLFYCFRENLFTSRLLSNIWKHISIRILVSCDVLVRENILSSSLQKIENQLDLQVNKTLLSC